MRRTAPAPAHVHPHASAPDAGEGAPRRAEGRDPADRGGAAGQRDTLRTEFSFQLPRGYVDEAGVVHRTGVMRLATARDELVPLRDDRVRENSAYLSVVLIARVVTRIGTIDDVHPGIIEDLFASDLAFLQDFYRRINAEGHTRAAVTCPACQEEFAVNLAGGRLGES
ncbi:hypothetical protein ACFYXM_26025 [Streptomyces sp. NPDC002476]|uniref:hypothetical protein n=1 Tax=Streptomyces sp. NPDC002476 TaxID=3364648 RepID=UPI00368C55CD